MITLIGKQKLEQMIRDLEKELEYTFSERNKAASEGDLKENSAYIFYGERAQVLMSQIEQAKADLKGAVVITPPAEVDVITYGHQVKVLFENDKRELTVTIVGKNDSQIKPGWVTDISPLGAALLGKKVGDKITVNDQPVKILNIEIGDLD